MIRRSWGRGAKRRAKREKKRAGQFALFITRSIFSPLYLFTLHIVIRRIVGKKKVVVQRGSNGFGGVQLFSPRFRETMYTHLTQQRRVGVTMRLGAVYDDIITRASRGRLLKTSLKPRTTMTFSRESKGGSRSRARVTTVRRLLALVTLLFHDGEKKKKRRRKKKRKEINFLFLNREASIVERIKAPRERARLPQGLPLDDR